MNVFSPFMACDAARRKTKNPLARLMTLGICALFAVSLLLSAAVAVAHMGHAHEHGHMGHQESCTLCAYVSAAHHLLKFLFAGCLGLSFAFGGLAVIFDRLKARGFHMDFPTLVFLKVRMND